MRIAKLEYLNVREVWRHEARDFTTWLAENTDHLADELGFALSSIETEKKIGSFTVDMAAEDEQGNPVIVENQLDKTDHTHLGQLLTYSVNAASKTIIWISPEPRDEHIAVIEWLNEITPVDTRWYLFRLAAVRIGDSPVSPMFTRIAGPSEEIKSRGSEKRQLAERHQKRLDFWTRLLEVLNQHTDRFRNINPSRENWLNCGSGLSGVYHSLIIRLDSASIQLIIGTGKSADVNKEIFDALFSKSDSIEERFGDEIVWRRMDDNVTSRIHHEITSCGLGDETTWQEGFEEISRKFARWDAAFEPHIPEARRILASASLEEV